jgi:hypothetical protein
MVGFDISIYFRCTVTSLVKYYTSKNLLFFCKKKKKRRTNGIQIS